MRQVQASPISMHSRQLRSSSPIPLSPFSPRCMKQPVLQQAQDIYGYLPIEVQKIIAEGLGIPLEQVYGVVTFYAQFSLNPKGKYSLAVCMGTACYVKGAGGVLERIKQKLGIEPGGVTPDGMFSLEETRCLGCCALAPVMTVNGEVHGRLVPDDVDRILDPIIKDNG